ncbi:hypothetical protein, partial [Piscirickettsia litoralis]|uniref:hypothetical protein n=1 Tax=Piscirickettsia litoralis TaxID=1891921 RepID=UPI0013016AC9
IIFPRKKGTLLSTYAGQSCFLGEPGHKEISEELILSRKSKTSKWDVGRTNIEIDEYKNLTTQEQLDLTRLIAIDSNYRALISAHLASNPEDKQRFEENDYLNRAKNKIILKDLEYMNFFHRNL